METLSSIVAQLGKKYAIFVPMVQKVLIKHKINHQSYDLLCARITEGGPMLDGVDGGQGYLSRHSRSRRRPGTGGSGANQVSRHKSFRALLLVFLVFFCLYVKGVAVAEFALLEEVHISFANLSFPAPSSASLRPAVRSTPPPVGQHQPPPGGLGRLPPSLQGRLAGLVREALLGAPQGIAIAGPEGMLDGGAEARSGDLNNIYPDLSI